MRSITFRRSVDLWKMRWPDFTNGKLPFANVCRNGCLYNAHYEIKPGYAKATVAVFLRDPIGIADCEYI